MKKLLLLSLLLAGCTTQTPYGKCIGALDKEDPKLTYAISGWNAFLGVIFSETIIVPAVVILYEIKCPVNSNEK